MKWKEAYRCKVCGQIYKSKYKDKYCKQCGAHIFFERSIVGLNTIPLQRFATENIEAIIIRRKWFKWEVGKSSKPEWLVQGKPPPPFNDSHIIDPYGNGWCKKCGWGQGEEGVCSGDRTQKRLCKEIIYCPGYKEYISSK